MKNIDFFSYPSCELISELLIDSERERDIPVLSVVSVFLILKTAWAKKNMFHMF